MDETIRRDENQDEISRLKDLLSSDQTHMVPGAFDAASARLAERAGFSALYVSGAATANGFAGLPDIELLSMPELVDIAGRIARSVSVPVVADADTGFGGPLHVRRTVQEFERAGLAAIHIEDQRTPKRCGHLADKQLVSQDEMAAKVRAAATSRVSEDFVVIARSDARAVEGLEEAIERARAYVDAGADAIFPEALQSEEEFAAFREALDVPLMANMTEFGRTPMLDRDRFEELGYSLVIYPVTALRAALQAAREVYEHLAAKGNQRDLLDRMMTRTELYELLDYPSYEDLEQSLYDGSESAGAPARGARSRPWEGLSEDG